VALRLEEQARSLAEVHNTADTLQGALALATDLAPCDVASVSMRRTGSIETTAATHDVAQQAHTRQVEIGEGPCLEAEWDQRGLNVVSDLGDDNRWPRWSREAQDLGLTSLLAVRLFTSKGTVGALDLYAFDKRDYDTDDILTAQLVAARVSAVLARTRHEETLWEAIDARHESGVAQGILMHRYGLTLDQAFAVLRRYSQQQNIKLRTLVQHVIEHQDLPAQ
jgi:GAF domain-containing protein